MAATIINFLVHTDINGNLCAYESGQHVPFDIRRIFTVSAKAGDIRGEHAHKKCTQLLVCASGKIRVACDDGFVTEEYILDNMGIGLLIPPGIWTREEFMVDNPVLMVLCDQGYEEDYIRNYSDFKLYLASKESR
jgi:dTDP-4-dehydrorhamnose 3,5-epimerase-like enzyme